MLRWVVLALLSICTLPVSAQALNLGSGARLELAAHVRFIEDPDGRYSLEEVRGMSWQPHAERTFNQGYSTSTWWLKLTLRNPTETRESRLLELGYAVLDSVGVFVVGEQGAQSLQLGDKQPYHERPVDHHHYLVPLEWAPGETLEVYLRLQSSGAMQAPLTLWQRSEFASFDGTRAIAQGIFFGTLLVIGAYNLLLYLALGDRNYLYYVSFVLALVLFLTALSGLAFRYLWPTMTTWNDQAINVFLSGAIMFGALFTRRFLQLREVSPMLAGAAWIPLLLGVGGLTLTFLAPYHLATKVVLINVLLGLPGMFLCGIYCWWRGVSAARFYSAAWLALLAGASALLLSKLSLVPVTFITEHGAHFGTSAAVLLLSFALAERINDERRLRYEAQADALRTTQRTNAELEQRVRERTRELEELNRQLQVLSNTDQLTGVKNRRFLERRLNEEWARCERYRHSLAVALIDIDFFKRVNDTYGHPAGDACLQEVARRIRSCLRWPGDEVARFGGEEFCLVLPETDREGALAVAERLRQRVESQPVAFESLQLDLTISIGVMSGVPAPEGGADRMIKQADLALYAAKQGGRNCVLHFDASLQPSATSES